MLPGEVAGAPFPFPVGAAIGVVGDANNGTGLVSAGVPVDNGATTAMGGVVVANGITVCCNDCDACDIAASVLARAA